MDLYLTAGQFDHLIYPSMFASAWDLGVGSSEWNPVLEAKLFNGYQITISFSKENDLRVKEYNFKLVAPCITKQLYTHARVMPSVFVAVGNSVKIVHWYKHSFLGLATS